MRLMRKHAARVISIFMIVLMLPISASAATSLKYNSEWIDFKLGKTYTLTMKSGQEAFLICEYDEDEGDVVLTKVKSSKPSVATVECDPDPDLADSFYIYAKSGGKTTITAKDSKGRIAKFTVTVKDKKSVIETTKWVYKSTKKVKVKATNVKKGDIIKFKVGSRTYKKKIKADAAKIYVAFKIKKPNFYGKKYKLTLVRKSKVIARERDYVYISNYVHVGDTKKKVKWLTSWNDPVKKNKSSSTEQWCYDWNEDGYHDAYLYFRNGKVYDWTIYE